MPGEDEHKDWCDEHDEEQGCATDWSGCADYDTGAEILTRILQRPGQAPIVQLSLQVDGSEVVADFSPHTLKRLGGEIEGLVSEARALAYQHEKETASS
ncbi:hypothetical protein [Micromonospora maritima]|uniref:hypothetical protein n=1 Tax=Micromonospora maritima TaxID=986711 RepID=UPI00157D1382|nr:hypothetical protein [Micromonospora maritima]